MEFLVNHLMIKSIMKIDFKIADISDVPQLKALWLESFDEKPEAVELIFNSFDIFTVCCAKCEDELVAAIYLIKGCVNNLNAHYMFGVATAKKYRKRGIMARLIEFSLGVAKQNGDVYSLLYPANDSLYSFYDKFGYTACYSATVFEKSRKELEEIANDLSKKSGIFDLNQLQKKCFKSGYFHIDNNFFDFAKKYYNLYDIKVVCSDTAFVIFEDNGEKAEVIYCVYDEFSSVATLLLNNTKAKKFLFTDKSKNKLNRRISGMIKSLDDKIGVCDDVYIGITLA